MKNELELQTYRKVTTGCVCAPTCHCYHDNHTLHCYHGDQCPHFPHICSPTLVPYCQSASVISTILAPHMPNMIQSYTLTTEALTNYLLWNIIIELSLGLYFTYEKCQLMLTLHSMAHNDGYCLIYTMLPQPFNEC